MKVIIGFISFMFISAIAVGQSIINVEYKKNGKKIELFDDFEFFFVAIDSNQKVIIKPVIIHNSFVAPDFYEQKKMTLVFRYKKKTMNLGLINFDHNQNMKWEIEYNNKKLKTKIGNGVDKNTKGIICISLNPLEKGDGVVVTTYIDNIKKYFNNSEMLLK